ncbi:MAG TPA: hypothetical protein PLM98_14025, partial [Thiolinea sp.]|nr:hypothetical protein [Thiolinea sp.]
EAGSGKTHECRAQAKLLWDKGEPAFFIELASLASKELRNLLDDEEEKRFDAWLLSQSDVATFFLDSYDELKLSRGSFDLALKSLKKAINSQFHRVRIVITTRPVPFDEQLVRRHLPVPLIASSEPKENSFAKIAMGEHRQKQTPSWEAKEKVADWRTVALMPLSDVQIAEFASEQGIDNPTALLDDLRKRNAQEFARRPQDLIELCADWREHKRIRTHRDQVASTIRLKLQARDDRPEPAELSADKAIDGASRLALAMLMTRRLTIRHSVASDNSEQEAALNPTIILSDWKPDEIKALLERPLFGFASYGRVRFHHRSVIEYLVSERLSFLLGSSRMTFRALKRLIFAETKGKIIVRPSMRPVAGWLALSDHRVFEILRDNEPAVLLNEGDPESLTQIRRNQALHAYVNRYGRGGWRGLSVPHIQIHSFASPALATEINQLWSQGIENPEIRRVLLSLIEAGRILESAEIVRKVVQDKTAPLYERVAGLQALLALADPLLDSVASEVVELKSHWSEQFRRNAIPLLFPKYLSIEQLCNALDWLEKEKNTLTNMVWYLTHVIINSEIDRSDWTKLRDGLVRLISKGLHWDEDCNVLTSD